MPTKLLEVNYNHIKPNHETDADAWIIAKGKDTDGFCTVMLFVPLYDGNFNDHHFPDWLYPIMAIAWDKECYYILFHWSADTIDGITEYIN
jgi:hypothetical protein